MKQIRLIPDDFDTLSKPCSKQFSTNWDCPIARAVKRIYKRQNIYVHTLKVNLPFEKKAIILNKQ